MEQQIAQGVSEGAILVAGGRRDGNFIAPAVFTGVRADMAVFREEIFGPVLPLVPFDAIDDAFAMVNDSPYGLQAAVFTQDLATVMSAYRRLDVGTVVINHPTAICVESLPFGGAKGSGNAREGIHDTLLDMTEARTLLMPYAFAGPRRPRHDAATASQSSRDGALCWSRRASTSVTAARMPCAASRSHSAPARSTPSSARTAPARAR